jgi:hypothetical protein
VNIFDILVILLVGGIILTILAVGAIGVMEGMDLMKKGEGKAV